MSTRAIQSELLLAGMVDPVTGETLAGGTVEFRSAGTTNFKNGWEDKDKTVPITSVELDDQGQAQVYFDGIYKFTVKNAAGTVRDTIDNLKYQARNTLTTTKVADYQCTAEDDYILADTSGGAITITLFAVAGVVAPISVKNIGASSNDVTVDGSGSEVIDGSLTQTLTDGAAQQYVTDGVKWYGAGAASGTVYTSSTLVSGSNNSFDVGSGITTINVPDASNTTKGAIEISTDPEAVTGTSEILATNPKQLKVVQDSINTKTETYTSTGQTITTSGQIILAHGLATAPRKIEYILQCITDELGYTAGDRVGTNISTDNAINTPKIDATNITIRYTNSGSCFRIGAETNGALSSIVNANWELYVNAWV